MITVKLQGGMGNQMFQAAYAMALEHRGYTVQLCNSGLAVPREYSLGVFGDLTCGAPTGLRVVEAGLPFDEKYLRPQDPSTMVGYWQTEKYFKDIEDYIRRVFSFRSVSDKIANLITSAKNTNSAFVHVRRGDYVNLQSYHGMPTMDYYRAAIERTGATNVLVFSDDPAWCKQNFDEDFTVMDGTTKYEDMQIMSSCKHAVVANSSFSWWAAWLRQTDGITVAPKQWFVDSNLDCRDIVPESWVRL